MEDKKFFIEDKRLLRLMKISVYDRYISMDRQLSAILFENDVDGLDFSEENEGIIFLPGYMFEIKRKGNNAVIYSKELTDYIRHKYFLEEKQGVQKLYISFNNNHFIIPKKSCIFLQNTLNSH